MKDEYYWNQFEKTGNIKDYLNYACTSEESMTGDYNHRSYLSSISAESAVCISESMNQHHIPGYYEGTTMAGSQNIRREEGGSGDAPRNRNGDGIVSHAHGRI